MCENCVHIYYPQRLKAKVQELYDKFDRRNCGANVTRLSMLPHRVYADSDIPDRLPEDMKFNP